MEKDHAVGWAEPTRRHLLALSGVLDVVGSAQVVRGRRDLEARPLPVPLLVALPPCSEGASLRRLLEEIPILAAEAWEYRNTPRGRAQATSTQRGQRHDGLKAGHHPAGTSKPPINLHVHDLLREDEPRGVTLGKGEADSHILGRLSMCARMVWEEIGAFEPSPGGTLQSVCDYLADSARWWLQQPGMSEDIAHEIRQAHHALSQAAHIPDGPTYLCPDCGEEADIGSDGRLLICNNGHETWWQEWAQDMEPLTAQQIETRFGVPPETIRTWKHKGWIDPVGKDGRRQLWAVVDVLAMANRERQAVGFT